VLALPIAGLAAFGPLSFGPSAAVAADNLPSLQRQLLKAAPQVLDYARKNGYRNLAVLKFRVKQGKRPITDRIGPLNLRVADQLELALVVKNPVNNPLGIVHDASSVAAKISGANHLTEEGRAPLFTGEFPLAWGKGKVTPDLFVTGVIELSDDFKRMTVAIVAFGKSAKLEAVTQFQANPTVTDVIAVGGSFSRGAFDGAATAAGDSTSDTTIQVAAVENASRVLSRQAQHPLQNPRLPVVLEIRYDNQLQTVEFNGGEARVREPSEGQKVTFVLRRRDGGDKRRYAVVLKVNGENTLYRQRLDDLVCRKWVLEPGERPLTIDGYQMTETETQVFKVLSKAASEARAIDYGADVGTYSIVVFTEQGGTPSDTEDQGLDDEGEDLAILQQGKLPDEPPDSLDVLKQRLLTTASRGLVAEGETKAGATRQVTFDCASTPVFAGTITYFHR
jgi:hypothetical protein